MLLRSLATTRLVEADLGFGGMTTVDTHPATVERERKLETIGVLEPAAYPALKSFRTAARRIMEVVETEARRLVEDFPAETVDQITQFRSASGMDRS